MTVLVFLTLAAVPPAITPPASAATDGPAAASAPAGSPDPPLITDRPDFTESTQVVPRGRIQLEGGYTFTHDHERGVRSTEHAFPELLLRAGLAPDLELRLGWSGWSLASDIFHTRTEADRRVLVHEHDDGGNDPSIGFKRFLRPADGLLPELGVIGELSLPGGSTTKTSGDVDPTVKLLWARDLGARLGLSGNVNLSVPSEQGRRFVQSAASLSLGLELSECVGAYVEYFGVYPAARGVDAAHTLNGGFTFAVTDNVQFDVRTGVGLNEQADDFFAGIGFAVRL